MSEIDRLVETVETARDEYVARVSGLSAEQADFRVDDDSWSITQITEHLVHAETGGINLIWRAADGFSRGKPVWTGESPNRGLSIEEVVRRTWKPRETSPESAVPRIGGPLGYWVAALRSCTPLLAALKTPLRGLPLESVIHPHVLSGPLDARQRLEFLAFHLRRHLGQVERTMGHPSFPGGDGRAAAEPPSPSVA